MNDIDQMPPKCQNCPYWELAKEPYCCGECSMELYDVTIKQFEDRNAKCKEINVCYRNGMMVMNLGE